MPPASGFSLAFAMVAFGLAALLTRRLAAPTCRFYLVDHPNERSLHTVPTPRTGGVAILAGFYAALALHWLVGRLLGVATPLDRAELAWTAGLAALAAVVSFWDDCRGLHPAPRLVAHVAIAVMFVAATGWRVGAIPVPLGGRLELEGAAVPVTILFITWMSNLYNFMDGMDGLAGGMTVFGFFILAAFAFYVGRPSLGSMALFVAGGAAGFLLYNLPPARIFMGDVGSIPLGFLAATLAVAGVHEGAFDVWVPLVVFSPFIADASITLGRRLLRGERVWRPHRTHYYQRLVQAGFGQRRTLAWEYALMTLAGVVAAAYLATSHSASRAALLTGWFSLCGVLAILVHAVEARYAGRRSSRS